MWARLAAKIFSDDANQLAHCGPELNTVALASSSTEASFEALLTAADDAETSEGSLARIAEASKTERQICAPMCRLVDEVKYLRSGELIGPGKAARSTTERNSPDQRECSGCMEKTFEFGVCALRLGDKFPELIHIGAHPGVEPVHLVPPRTRQPRLAAVVIAETDPSAAHDVRECLRRGR